MIGYQGWGSLPKPTSRILAPATGPMQAHRDRLRSGHSHEVGSEEPDSRVFVSPRHSVPEGTTATVTPHELVLHERLSGGEKEMI